MWEYSYTGRDNDYARFLMHHGILGQKWGVRRFQNPDGSLTPEGRKRYSKLADSYKKGEEYFYYKVNSLKEVKDFSKENKKDKNALLDAQYDYDLAGESYNKAAYAYAEKKAGASYGKIMRMNDVEKQMRLVAFLEAGIEFADTEEGKAMGKKLREAQEDYIAKSKAYEHKVTQFVKDLLSDYGDTPIPGTLSIDTKTLKSRESTLTEQMAIEMLRDAQRGRIDF